MAPPKVRVKTGGDFCSAPNCQNARYKIACKGWSFFRFPRDQARSTVSSADAPPNKTLRALLLVPSVYQPANTSTYEVYPLLEYWNMSGSACHCDESHDLSCASTALRQLYIDIEDQKINALVAAAPLTCPELCGRLESLVAHPGLSYLVSVGCLSSQLPARSPSGSSSSSSPAPSNSSDDSYSQTSWARFARINGSFLLMTRFLLAFLEAFDIHGQRLALCLSLNDHVTSGWREMADEISRNRLYINSSGGDMLWMMNDDTFTKENTFLKEFNTFALDSSVFLIMMNTNRVLQFLENARKNKLLDGGTVFITFDYFNRLKILHLAKIKDLTGLLDISLYQTLNTGGVCTSQQSEVFVQDLINDSVSLLTEMSKDVNQIAKFQGSKMEVTIVPDGTRLQDFQLTNIQQNCLHLVGLSNYSRTRPMVRYSQQRKVVWPANRPNPPTCPRGGCQTNKEDQAWTTVLVITFLVLVYLVMVLLRCIVSIIQQSQRDWIIPAEMLYENSSISHKSGKKLTTTSAIEEVIGMPAAASDQDAAAELFRSLAQGQLFSKVAVINLELVAVRPVFKSSIALTKDLLKEIKQIRRLEQSNVNQLVGACIEVDNMAIVWKYCNKGSLHDILLNPTIKLDWMFKLSFITDIARGMTYIHSSRVGTHGCLKSRNVVVDRDWCCKITDLKMPIFRKNEVIVAKDVVQQAYNLLWTAPELLRMEFPPDRGTKKGDVYAFAIIVNEVLNRCEPFGLTPNQYPADVLHRVAHEENPPFRPWVPDVIQTDVLKITTDKVVKDLMVMCWDEYPNFRLSFPTVFSNLRIIRSAYGMKTNLVDQLTGMLRQYTDNLEELVEERTEQLKGEQKKAEDLVCRLLPRSVAAELKKGNMVKPESYECITIFFSDIVGFTSLSAKSTPMEVVKMLGNLYLAFDSVVDQYDAYKIETIGDAYMVVSGLPNRIRDHAGEIATVALNILRKVLFFVVPHCPEHQLLLRIGIHSGPVVAGVVGHKMPRYCLFGATVTFAAKMESHGEPLHIHISPQCKAQLDKLSGYIIKEKGPVEFKDIGTIVTYYLVGKAGFEVDVSKLKPDVIEKVGINVVKRANLQEMMLLSRVPSSKRNRSLKSSDAI